MGKGKTKSDSTAAYINAVNNNIDNKIFDSKRTVYPEKIEDRKVRSFYERYFLNGTNKVSVTRNPLSVDNIQARKKFHSLTANYEYNNELKLSDVSKEELMCNLLDFVEITNSLIKIKDNAKQFMPYRLLFPDVVKLYLYKLFYPRIFDFEVQPGIYGDFVKFKSTYINKNFDVIYRQIELMCLAIVYDAMLIAIEQSVVQHIESMKTYKAFVTVSDCAPKINDALDIEFNATPERRIEIIKKLKPSIVFLSRHYDYFHRKGVETKLITAILKGNTFYAGKKAYESRNALIDAYRECSQLLNNFSPPFTRLFNLYYINKRSSLYDLNIIKNNVGFLPYFIDGLVTKHHIDSMILDNSKKLHINPGNLQDLTSVYVNPNCIITNLTSRDYEIINYIITRIADTFRIYYLIANGIDVPASRICELIDWIDREKLTETINNIVHPFDFLKINNVDYEAVLKYQKGGEMTGLCKDI